MKLEDKLHRMKGRLSVKVIDRAGKVVSEDTGNNLIVDMGYKVTADLLSGQMGAAITKAAVGTNPAAPDPADIQITDAFIVTVDGVDSLGDTTIRFNFTIPYDCAANGKVISEYGLMTQNGRLFARRTRASVTKTANLMIAGAWDISI